MMREERGQEMKLDPLDVLILIHKKDQLVFLKAEQALLLLRFSLLHQLVFLKVREVGPENVVQFLKVREVGPESVSESR
jgi:hypothetical protein